MMSLLFNDNTHGIGHFNNDEVVTRLKSNDVNDIILVDLKPVVDEYFPSRDLMPLAAINMYDMNDLKKHKPFGLYQIEIGNTIQLETKFTNTIHKPVDESLNVFKTLTDQLKEFYIHLFNNDERSNINEAFINAVNFYHVIIYANYIERSRIATVENIENDNINKKGKKKKKR